MITAVPTTPAYSMIGKYFDEMRTVCMFAWYWSSFVRWNLRGERVFAAERLHDAHAFEALLQRAQVGRDPVAHLEVRLVRHPPEPAAAEVHGRHDHEDAERELPRDDEDDGDRADEHERVLHEQHEALRDELLHRVDVGGHAGDDLARLLGLEVVEREAHHVPEQPVAQLAEEPFTDARDEDDRDPPEDEAREREDEVDERP